MTGQLRVVLRLLFTMLSVYCRLSDTQRVVTFLVDPSVCFGFMSHNSESRKAVATDFFRILLAASLSLSRRCLCRFDWCIALKEMEKRNGNWYGVWCGDVGPRARVRKRDAVERNGRTLFAFGEDDSVHNRCNHIHSHTRIPHTFAAIYAQCCSQDAPPSMHGKFLEAMSEEQQFCRSEMEHCNYIFMLAHLCGEFDIWLQLAHNLFMTELCARTGSRYFWGLRGLTVERKS